MPNTIKPTLSADVKALAELAPDAETHEKLLKLASMLDENPDPKRQIPEGSSASVIPSKPRSSR